MNQLGRNNAGREGWKEEEGKKEITYDGEKGWSEGGGKEGH